MIYKVKQLQSLDKGDKRPNKCKFPFDGVGRSYDVIEKEKPLWGRVVQHFLAINKDVRTHYDERTRRYLCTIYLYYRIHCNKNCPGYAPVTGASTRKVIPDFKKEKDDKKSKLGGNLT